MQKNYLLSKYIILACYGLMLVLFLFWFATRPSGLNFTVLAIQVIPVFAFLPGIAANHYRSYSWLCFILLFYFIKGVEGALVSTASISDLIFLLLSVVMFCSSMMASRWCQRLFKQSNPNTPTAG